MIAWGRRCSRRGGRRGSRLSRGCLPAGCRPGSSRAALRLPAARPPPSDTSQRRWRAFCCSCPKRWAEGSLIYLTACAAPRHAGVSLLPSKHDALPQGLPHCATVLKSWQASVPALGGGITQDPACAAISHALVPQPGGGWASLPPCLRPGSPTAPPGLAYVTQQWVSASLRRQQRQAEGEHRPAAEAGAPAAAPAPQPARPPSAYEEWLGPLWRPECADMEFAELMLQVCVPVCVLPASLALAPGSAPLPPILLSRQGDYDEQRCQRIGNEPVGACARRLPRPFALSTAPPRAPGPAAGRSAPPPPRLSHPHLPHHPCPPHPPRRWCRRCGSCRSTRPPSAASS